MWCIREIQRYVAVCPSNVTLIVVISIGTSIRSVDTYFCQRFAKSIIENSPVDYVREMKLCGSLFDANCKTGAISAVFTSFYVDHTEPLEALAEYREHGPWALGELLEGHEFLVILQVSPMPNDAPAAN